MAFSLITINVKASATQPSPAAAHGAGKAGHLHHAIHPLRSFYDTFIKQIDIGHLFTVNSWGNWLVLLIAIFAGVALGRFAGVLMDRLSRRLEARHWHVQSLMFEGLVGPANLLVVAAGLFIGLGQLHLSGLLESASRRGVLLLFAIAVFWYVFNIVSIVEHGLKHFASRHEQGFNTQFIPIIRKTLRIFVAIIGVLFIVQNVFDRDIGSWLAGLGIAGLAVSLAAQDSLKNIFGSLTIFLDRPFFVGNSIIYQGFTGTVEEIGFRSTRVRQLDGSLVNIPNSDIVNNSVCNLANRPYFRRILNVTITYDTPAVKINQAIEIIRSLLASEAFAGSVINPDNPADNPPRVFFNDFNADSLNILVNYCYRPTTDWWAFVGFNERFNLALFEAYDKAGIEFAFPTRTLYLAGDAKRQLALRMLGNDGQQPA